MIPFLFVSSRKEQKDQKEGQSVWLTPTLVFNERITTNSRFYKALSSPAALEHTTASSAADQPNWSLNSRLRWHHFRQLQRAPSVGGLAHDEVEPSKSVKANVRVCNRVDFGFIWTFYI